MGREEGGGFRVGKKKKKRILDWVAMPSSSLSWFKCNPNLFLSRALSSLIFPAELPFLTFSFTILDAVNPAGG